MVPAAQTGGAFGGGGLGAGTAGGLGRSNLSGGFGGSSSSQFGGGQAGFGQTGIGQSGTGRRTGPRATTRQQPRHHRRSARTLCLADLNREDPTRTPMHSGSFPTIRTTPSWLMAPNASLAPSRRCCGKSTYLPLQVRIDAVIAEVTLNDNLQYGTQFFFQAGGINSVLSNSTQPAVAPAASNLSLSLPGFLIGGHGAGGAPFAIQALQQVTTVHVLSSPELLVLDNQPARLQVGNVVPYLSQTSQSTLTENAPIVSSINYQQTGVIMQVTPRVNSGGLVTLDVMQDVSNVVTGLTTPGVNSPTFDERNVTSRVVVQDGQTIGLAGLITDNTSKGNQGIPWLKDVPILGLLAGTQNNTRQRTELLILITPHVIHDQRDARALTDDLREQLINAAAVPDLLNNLRPSGASDPSARLRQKLNLQPQ